MHDLQLTARRGSTEEQIVEQIDNVGNINCPVTISISSLQRIRRRSTYEKVIYQVDDVSYIYFSVSIGVTTGAADTQSANVRATCTST